MNRGKKIAAMVTKESSSTPKKFKHNNCKYDKNITVTVENWSDNGNGIEVDSNRLNGVDIDDYIIEFERNNAFKDADGESSDLIINTYNGIEELENNLSNIEKELIKNIVLLDTQ